MPKNHQKPITPVKMPRTRLKDESIYQKMIGEVQDYAIILLSREGIIQNWNRGAEKIKQYTAAEAVGRHFRMFYLPEDREAGVPEWLLGKAATEGRAIHEGWRQRKDGTKFWGSITLTALHDEQDQVIGFSKMTRDLTEKKLAEDRLEQLAEQLRQSNHALRNSEESYHRMIAEVQDYAIILLDANGTIKNWNLGAQKIKGYSASEIVGQNFRVFYRPQDQQNGLPEKLIAEAEKTGKAVHEGWRIRKDGTEFWGSIVITALHSDDGSLIGFSKVTRDLTERKRAEDKMKAYLEELKLQNEQLEQFAFVASHDLQEPLRKIRTFASLIQLNIHNPETTARYLGKIETSAGRMAELVTSILCYSRLTTDKNPAAACDLDSILSHVLEDFELLIQEKGALIVADPLPVITGIPSQVNQLFTNLVGNALKFSDGKPELRITSQTIRSDQPGYVPKSEHSEYWHEIRFTDNGIGFDQQYEQQIFRMFQRLHSRDQYAGTGIGLALCKKIMDNHGGFITASGTPGKGASFRVCFPAGPVQ